MYEVSRVFYTPHGNIHYWINHTNDNLPWMAFCRASVKKRSLRMNNKVASKVCVPTNTKKHPNRCCGTGVFFWLVEALPQTLSEHKVFWVTLPKAVATQFCESLV